MCSADSERADPPFRRRDGRGVYDELFRFGIVSRSRFEFCTSETGNQRGLSVLQTT